MKSINYLFFRYYGKTFIYVILAFISSVLCSPPPCGLYGAPPCQFLPAPPGHTPSCARPGKTYCEHVDNYPTYLIKHLVHKWGYEAKNLLVDETWEEFSALGFWHDVPHFYDPAYIFPPQRPYGSSGSSGNGDFNGYKYNTPLNGESSSSSSSAASSASSTNSDDTYFLAKAHTTIPPTSAGQRLNLNKNQAYPYGGGGNNNNKVSPNNPTLWLKRIARELSQKYGSGASNVSMSVAPAAAPLNSSSLQRRHTRDVSINMDLLDIVGVGKGEKSRIKRQSPGRTQLCQTATQFITPQAALNSKGNWMFVVNEANTARQMVKAELCASSTCSNLCQLPNGYNSRCEQKFVQKRLIALQANGQNLYTDSFWFPSCCVCTISSI